MILKRDIPYLYSSTSLLGNILKTSLHTLELHGFFFHLGDITDLCSSLATNCKYLKTLSLSNNNLYDYGAINLAKALKDLPKLEKLSLYNNGIGDHGAEKIAESLERSEVQNICLQMNQITDVGVSQFANRLWNVQGCMYPNLKKIMLSGNQVSEKMKKLVKEKMPIILI